MYGSEQIANFEFGSITDRGFDYSLSISETVSISESYSKTFVRGVSESVTIGERIAKDFVRSIRDTIGIVDNYSRLLALIRSVSESITVTEVYYKNFGRSLRETYSIIDNVVATHIGGRILKKMRGIVTSFKIRGSTNNRK